MCGQVNSTYSEIFAHDGSKDRMDQLPYYSIVAKLEKQNSLLMAERQNFQTQLDVQLSNMSGLSNQIQACLSFSYHAQLGQVL